MSAAAAAEKVIQTASSVASAIAAWEVHPTKPTSREMYKLRSEALASGLFPLDKSIYPSKKTNHYDSYAAFKEAFAAAHPSAWDARPTAVEALRQMQANGDEFPYKCLVLVALDTAGSGKNLTVTAATFKEHYLLNSGSKADAGVECLPADFEMFLNAKQARFPSLRTIRELEWCTQLVRCHKNEPASLPSAGPASLLDNAENTQGGGRAKRAAVAFKPIQTSTEQHSCPVGNNPACLPPSECSLDTASC